MARHKKSLDGERFGALLVRISEGMPVRNDRSGGILWPCVCNCGREIYARDSALISGGTRSCGACTEQDWTEEGTEEWDNRGNR